MVSSMVVADPPDRLAAGGSYDNRGGGGGGMSSCMYSGNAYTAGEYRVVALPFKGRTI